MLSTGPMFVSIHPRNVICQKNQIALAPMPPIMATRHKITIVFQSTFWLLLQVTLLDMALNEINVIHLERFSISRSARSIPRSTIWVFVGAYGLRDLSTALSSRSISALSMRNDTGTFASSIIQHEWHTSTRTSRHSY